MQQYALSSKELSDIIDICAPSSQMSEWTVQIWRLKAPGVMTPMHGISWMSSLYTFSSSEWQ